MKMPQIKAGRWYETKLGVGECLKSGGTHPPSVMVRIDLPFPRGRVNLTPREVFHEVPPPPKP